MRRILHVSVSPTTQASALSDDTLAAALVPSLIIIDKTARRESTSPPPKAKMGLTRPHPTRSLLLKINAKEDFGPWSHGQQQQTLSSLKNRRSLAYQVGTPKAEALGAGRPPSRRGRRQRRQQVTDLFIC